MLCPRPDRAAVAGLCSHAKWKPFTELCGILSFILRLLSVYAGNDVSACNISMYMRSHIHTLSTIFMAV